MKTNVLSEEDQAKKLEIQKDFEKKRKKTLLTDSFVVCGCFLSITFISLIVTACWYLPEKNVWHLIIILVIYAFFIWVFISGYLYKFKPENEKLLTMYILCKPIRELLGKSIATSYDESKKLKEKYGVNSYDEVLFSVYKEDETNRQNDSARISRIEIMSQAYDEITERNFWQYLRSKKWLKKIK